MTNISLLGFKGRAKSFYDVFKKKKTEIEKLIDDKIDIKYILIDDQEQNQDEIIKELAEKELFTTDFNKILNDPEVDIIIELTGEENSALDFILQSIKKEKIVITASRKAVAENYKKIQNLKREFNTEIFFEASTGPIPINKIISDYFILDKINKIEAVLNESSNYILSLMENETISMKETIKKAENLIQEEIKSETDLEGLESLYKISIIADLAFKTFVDPEKIHLKGIKGITSYDIIYAEELGYKIKLLAVIENKDNEILIGVRPNLIKKEQHLADVDADCSRIEIYSEFNKKSIFQASVNGDYSLLNVLNKDLFSALNYIREKNNNSLRKELEINFNNNIKISDLYSNLKNSFYIRLQVEKEESNMKEIKEIFSEKDLAELILHDNMTETPLLPVIIITKEIKESRLEKILSRIEELDGVLTINNIIPIKKDL